MISMKEALIKIILNLSVQVHSARINAWLQPFVRFVLIIAIVGFEGSGRQ